MDEKNKTYYYSFSEYLRQRFGVRVHRISINAGFSCPNRDGTLSDQGCIFCNEEGFSHYTGVYPSIEEQIATSMGFIRERFKAEKFIAYFQNASNTYADVDTLRQTYDVIKKFPDIVGLTISTRPDCIDKAKLDLIDTYAGAYDVWIEYGLQSIHEKTLKTINRLHSTMQFLEAIEQTAKRRIKIGVHVILGLPGESKEEIMETADVLSTLPIDGVKLHVLHVLRDTKLQEQYKEGKIQLLESDEYVQLACDFLERLSPKCVVMRLVSDANKDVLIAPEWINQKHKVRQDIEDEFQKRGTRQGCRGGPRVRP
ncbi:MAG: TIGR01212 family radical SAM protein [Candidatus Omnitrophota bacterium]